MKDWRPRRLILVLSLGLALLSMEGVPGSRVVSEGVRSDDGLSVQDAATSFLWHAEAESGHIVWPMTPVWSPGASACGYVHSDVRDGSVTFTIVVPADGDYHLWARAMGVEAYLNSFYVSFDAGEEFAYEIPSADGAWDWVWHPVHLKHGPVHPFRLSAGAHTLRFRPREASARLDAVVLSGDNEFIVPDSG